MDTIYIPEMYHVLRLWKYNAVKGIDKKVSNNFKTLPGSAISVLFQMLHLIFGTRIEIRKRRTKMRNISKKSEIYNGNENYAFLGKPARLTIAPDWGYLSNLIKENTLWVITMSLHFRCSDNVNAFVFEIFSFYCFTSSIFVVSVYQIQTFFGLLTCPKHFGAKK